MKFISLELAKSHLNLDPEFVVDDKLIILYCNAAERSVAEYLDIDMDDVVDEDGNLPEPIVAGILLMLGNLYMVRESISATSFTEVPFVIKCLLEPYRDYSGERWSQYFAAKNKCKSN